MPNYAAYAAQAWLRNNPTLNVVRLLGEEDPNATEAGGKAGWKFGSISATDTEGGAWGYLFGHPLQDQQLVLKFSKQRVPWQLFSTVDDDTAGGRVLCQERLVTIDNPEPWLYSIKSDSNGEFVASITAGGRKLIRLGLTPTVKDLSVRCLTLTQR